MRKIRGVDRGQLYAMKVLKKATLKGENKELKSEMKPEPYMESEGLQPSVNGTFSAFHV